MSSAPITNVAPIMLLSESRSFKTSTPIAMPNTGSLVVKIEVMLVPMRVRPMKNVVVGKTVPTIASATMINQPLVVSG